MYAAVATALASKPAQTSRSRIMKKKAVTFALLSVIGITLISVAPIWASSSAQERDQDRDRNEGRDRDRDRDDSTYRNNRYYKQGWKDGEHHNHKNHKWKNDDDRRAYEAGYARGDRGDEWQNGPDHDRH
jgi:hypothetical protein